MLSSLVNHNLDLRKLIEKGYALAIDSAYLVVRDIPFLDEHRALQMGAIVSKLKFVDREKIEIEDHQIFFCGSHPCQLNGTPIPNLGGGVASLALTATDVTVQRSFSNKPSDGFHDFYEKIESYVTIISGPAMELYPSATPLTFRIIDPVEGSVFKLADTLTSLAEIGDLALKFKDDVVAIIGLGGTGSYLLDLLVKTPVKEIRGFDLDRFYVHNAFRSPGRQIDGEFRKTKAEVYQARYEEFRRGLSIRPQFIVADSEEYLQGVTFAFIAVDKGSARTGIVDLLTKMNIPFIDVGMGLDRKTGPISGTVRSTYVPQGAGERVLGNRWLPMDDPDDDEYRINIQIAELNALNACLAVIKFKQLRGFYVNDCPHDQILLTVDNLLLAKE